MTASMRARILTPIGILAVSVAVWAQQADRTQTEAAARRNTERMQALQREAERLSVEQKTLLGELRKLEVERQLRTEELRKLDGEAARVQAELATTTERSETLQSRERAARPELRARLVEIYKLGGARYLRLLLSTRDVRQLGEASRAVAALAQLDRTRVTLHQRTLQDLKTARAALEERRLTLATLRRDTLTAQTAVVRAAQAKNDLIRDIEHRRDLNAQFAGELQAAQQRLQVTLREAAAPPTAAAASAAPSATAVLPSRADPRPPDVRSEPKAARGELDWPVAGAVQRRFDPSLPRRSGASNGIEIGAAEGTPATAVHDGTVAFADIFSGFGNLVIVDHGAQTFSVYGNLLDISVRKGARVERGQPVGTVGTAPTGAAGLYFELRVDGQPVDPVQWFRKRPENLR